MTRTGDLAVTPEGWAASQAKQRAELAANPQFREMAKAAEPTKAEQSEIAAAEAALAEAEEAVNTLGLAGSKYELEEARLRVQNARRRLNASVRAISAARSERRRAAKAKHAPKREPTKSHGDPWVALARSRVDR